MPVSKVAIVRHLITYPLCQHVGRMVTPICFAAFKLKRLSSLREPALPPFPY